MNQTTDLSSIVQQHSHSQSHRKTLSESLEKTIQRLHREKQIQKDKISTKVKQLQQLRKQKELDGCTFKPTINKNKEIHIDSNFMQRGANWTKSKQKKIQALLKAKEEQEETKLNFKPEIHPLPKNIKNKQQNQYSKKIQSQKKGYREIHLESAKLKHQTKIIIKPFQLSYAQKNKQDKQLSNSNNLVNKDSQKQNKILVPKNSLNDKINVVHELEEEHETEEKDVYEYEIQNQQCLTGMDKLYQNQNPEQEGTDKKLNQDEEIPQEFVNSQKTPYMFNLADESD